MKMNMRVFHENERDGGMDAGISGEHYAIVFDGLGGTGGITCRDAEGRIWTEAKVAANAAARAAQETIRDNWNAWNLQLDPTIPGRAEAVAHRLRDEIRSAIDARLAQEALRWNKEGEVRSLPTTIAGWVTFPQQDGKLLAVMLWAGDSRCYIVDEARMRQMSEDDSIVAEGEDMMSEILSQESPSMSNIIGIRRDYHISCKPMLISGPALLFACTDGMYNSVQSPMHLEYFMRACVDTENMEQAERELQDFLATGIRVHDDSATVCALAYAPRTGTFDEVSDALRPRVAELEETYINVFPEPPERPGGEVEGPLRRLAADLATTKTFRQGLYRHILRLAEEESIPVIPGLQHRGLELLGNLHARARACRNQHAAEVERAEALVREEEDMLRGAIAGLGARRLQKRELGPSGFTPAWEASNASVARRVEYIFAMLQDFRGRLFISDDYGDVRYMGPSMSDLAMIDPYLHDLVHLLNQSENGGMLQQVFAHADETVWVTEPLDDSAREAIFEALVRGGSLPEELDFELQLTARQLDTLLRLARNVRELRRKCQYIREKAEGTVEITLTEEECETIDSACAVPFARQFVTSWYRQHQMPGTIAIADTMVPQCLERLQQCWDVDELKQGYNEEYEAFRRRVMAMWESYKPGYSGWNAPTGLPEFIEAAAPEAEEPAQEPEQPVNVKTGLFQRLWNNPSRWDMQPPRMPDIPETPETKRRLW